MEKEQNILFNPQPSVFDSSVVVSNGTTFTVDNRTLISAAPVTDVVVQNDAMSKCISITMQRYFDNIDLSLKQINVIYSNAYGQSGTSVIGQSSIQETTDTIIISWWLPSEIAAAAGTVEFQMRFFDLDNTGKVTYMWQTKITTFNVERSIEALQQAYANTYDIERAFELANRDNVTWTSILDYNVPINIKNRTCENIPTDLVLKGDTNSQALSFVIPRFLDKVDLATKVITIKYVNALGLSDRSRAINTIIDTDTITFTWLINSRFTIESGSGLFAVEILGYNFPDGRPVPPVVQPEDLPYFYVWQTKPVTVVIEKSLYVDGSIPMPTPDWEASWQVVADKNLRDSTEQANISKEQATIATNKANEAASSASSALTSKNLAQASANAAKDSENASKVSENNAAASAISASASAGNKGYFANVAALLQQYPNTIARPSDRTGWLAYVGSTDSLWAWDVNENKWVQTNEIVMYNNDGEVPADTNIWIDLSYQPTEEIIYAESIVNNLTSGGARVPLSAEMGKELKRLIDTKTITVVNNLISSSTTDPLSAAMGKKLQDEKLGATATATAAAKLTSNNGSATQPVYFANGVPVATTYLLEKSVPSNAVFTDTLTPVQNNLTSTSTTDALSAAQGKVLSEGKLDKNSVVNNLTTTTTTVPLSAAQGKVLADRTRNLDSDGSGIVVSGQLTRSGANANYGIIYKGTSFYTPSTWQDGDLYIVYK